MPCKAVKLTVECNANNKLARKKRRSRPPFLNEYSSIDITLNVLKIIKRDELHNLRGKALTYHIRLKLILNNKKEILP